MRVLEGKYTPLPPLARSIRHTCLSFYFLSYSSVSSFSPMRAYLPYFISTLLLSILDAIYPHFTIVILLCPRGRHLPLRPRASPFNGLVTDQARGLLSNRLMIVGCCFFPHGGHRLPAIVNRRDILWNSPPPPDVSTTLVRRVYQSVTCRHHLISIV